MKNAESESDHKNKIDCERIGVLGGSFDPVHNGHIMLATSAIAAACLEKVIFMPVNVQPFKRERDMAFNLHRLAMLERAIGDNPAFECSDIEINSSGISYTINSLRRLRGIYGSQSRLFFIMGADMFVMLDQWYESDALLREFAFIVGRRRSGQLADREVINRKAEHIRTTYGTEIICMNNEFADISASGIRSLIGKGEPVSELLPAGVEGYILEHGLYSGKP